MLLAWFLDLPSDVLSGISVLLAWGFQNENALDLVAA